MKTRKMRCDFLNQDQIPNDNIREFYTKLLVAYKTECLSKDQALESLRIETLVNEEQKNYIAILQQTIENKINKLRLANFISNQKKLYYKESNNNIEVILDVVELKTQNENLRKDLILSDAISNELRKENEKLQNDLNKLSVSQKEIYDELHKKLKELEKSKEENQKNDEIIKQLEKDVQNLQINKDELQGKAKRLEKENVEINLECHEIKSCNKFQENTINELKESNSRIIKLNEEFTYENEKMKGDYLNMKNLLITKVEEIRKLDLALNDKESKLGNLKSELSIVNDDIENRIKKNQINNEKKDFSLKEKENLLKVYKENYLNSEKMCEDLKSSKKRLNNDLIQVKKSYEDTIFNLSNEIKELKLKIEDYVDKLDNLKREKQKFEQLNSKLKDNLNIIDKDKSGIEEDYISLKAINEKLSNQLDDLAKLNKSNDKEKKKLLKDLGSLNNEYTNLKEIFDIEISKKNSEITEINYQIKTDNIEIKMLKDNILSLNE